MTFCKQLFDGGSTNTDSTALLLASHEGDKEVVQALLDKGADVNAKMNDGATALMLASMNGHKEVVQALLDKEADVNTEVNGTTALSLASDKGHKEVKELLSRAGPKIGTHACDICNERLNIRAAYLLTTSQVVLSSNYWEFFWQHYPDHAARAGERGENLSSYAIERAADLTQWTVCQRCVALCTTDPAAAARSFQEITRLGGRTLMAPLCGPPSDWKLAVAAAEEG